MNGSKKSYEFSDFLNIKIGHKKKVIPIPIPGIQPKYGRVSKSSDA